jgi:hypothetical protein
VFVPFSRRPREICNQSEIGKSDYFPIYSTHATVLSTPGPKNVRQDGNPSSHDAASSSSNKGIPQLVNYVLQRTPSRSANQNDNNEKENRNNASIQTLYDDERCNGEVQEFLKLCCNLFDIHTGGGSHVKVHIRVVVTSTPKL